MSDQQQSFQEFASTELNRLAALRRVTKMLCKMEGMVQDTCSNQSVSRDQINIIFEISTSNNTGISITRT